jgi:RHS repeat-associated protein
MRQVICIILLGIISTAKICAQNLNFVRTWMAAVADQDALHLISRPTGEVFQTTQYFDGLGRPVQTVEKGVSAAAGNNWKDLVKHYEYDAAGRVIRDYLVYAAAENPGNFKTNAVAAQPAYITSFFGEPSNAPTYSLVGYDESPLNRITKSMAPGQSWAGNGIGVSAKEDYNNANEKVHIWNLDYNSSALPVTNPTLVYTTGTLSKSIVTDEKQNKVISYTDLSGNLILKKVQEAASPGIEHSGWVCTYYVYDDLGRLRYTISPKAVEYLDNNSWSLNQTIADELCFKYLYDKKGRMIVKKQPGAGEEKMIYDKKDRLVLTQHSNQDKANNTALTKNQWSFVLYDDLNRSLAIGLLDNDGSQASLQGLVTSLTNPVMTITALLGTGGSQSLSVDNPVAGSSGTANYLTGTSNIIYNSITHYDNYNYSSVKSFSNTYTLAYNSSTPNIEQTVQTNRTTGMVTGEKTRILDGDNDNTNDKFLFSTAYYDEEGRTLESLVDNINMNNGTGVDFQVNQYDFAGKLMSSYTSHKPNTSTTYTITSKNEFDKIGRLTKLFKNFNNSFYKQLAEYTYDELGQLKTKRLAPGYPGTAGPEIELMAYDYNIQGWITGINKDYALGDNNYSQWDRYFGMYLGYDNRDGKFVAPHTPQYNGNISGTIWKSQGDNTPRKFDFEYDNLDRFTKANFKQRKKPSETTWENTEVDFSTTVEYEDGNGNIKSMKHMGVIPGINNGVAIDDLRYTYLSTGVTALNGNKLKQVDDLGTLSATNNGLLGDFKDGNTTQDYFYDVNGNLVKDLNKSIKNASANGITYNYMNKPEKIVIEGKSTIEFTYDASGEKLKKKVTYVDNSIRYTTYIGDYVYEQFIPSGGGGLGDQLQYVLHEEGRLKIIIPHTKVNPNDYDLNAGNYGLVSWPGGKQGVFEYFIKDHLGSTRMVLTEEVQKEYYAATMEYSARLQEEPLFGQVDANGNAISANELRVTRLVNSAATTPWPGNASDIVKLTATASNTVVGPNMVLKVMAGDMITSNVKYYYPSASASGGTGNILSTIGNIFIHSLTGANSSNLGKNQSGLISSNLTNNSDFIYFIQNDHTGTGSRPKAYLNVVFLDEQFKFIKRDPVNSTVGTNYFPLDPNSAGNTNLIMYLQQKAPKNGWVYVYISNESSDPVYFDDLSVIQEHSHIAEENHYYPYGLKIGGISSNAVAKLQNKIKFTDQLFDDDGDLNWYGMKYRNYDPQIGRFLQTDPLSDFYPHNSPYAYAENAVINSVDLEGLERYVVINGFDQQNRIIRKVIYTVQDANGLTDIGFKYFADGSRVAQNDVLVVNFPFQGAKALQHLSALSTEDQNLYDTYVRERNMRTNGLEIGSQEFVDFGSGLITPDRKLFMAGINYIYPQPQAVTNTANGPVRNFTPTVNFIGAQAAFGPGGAAAVANLALWAPNFAVTTPVFPTANGRAFTTTTVRSTIGISLSTNNGAGPFTTTLLSNRFNLLANTIVANTPRGTSRLAPFFRRQPIINPLAMTTGVPLNLLNAATGNLVNFFIRTTTTTVTTTIPNTPPILRPF